MLSRIYNTTWRGLACVAYLWKGAMRRPEVRDKRGGTKLPRSFFSRLKKQLITAKLGSL